MPGGSLQRASLSNRVHTTQAVIEILYDNIEFYQQWRIPTGSRCETSHRHHSTTSNTWPKNEKQTHVSAQDYRAGAAAKNCSKKIDADR